MENRSDVVASVVLAGVVLLVGAPVAILQASGDDPTAGPWWLWWVCYAAYIGCTVATVWVAESGHHGRGAWLGIAAMATTGITLYLLGSQGWTAVLLVLTAAIAAFIASRRSIPFPVPIAQISRVPSHAYGAAGAGFTAPRRSRPSHPLRSAIA